MQTVADRPEAPTAIRTDLGAIFVSLELSRSTWLITSLSPGGGEKMSKHVVRGGDVAGLLERFAQLRKKTRTRTGKVFPFVVIQEAGLDGFWIDRVLQNEGIESHVVDPASIATSRRRRRGETDRDDGRALGRRAPAGEDGQDRRRGAGSRAAGVKTGRASGVRDGQGTNSRGRGPPPPLSRAQGADRRAGPARQSGQGAAVLTGDIWLRTAAPRPARAAGYAADW